MRNFTMSSLRKTLLPFLFMHTFFSSLYADYTIIAMDDIAVVIPVKVVVAPVKSEQRRFLEAINKVRSQAHDCGTENGTVYGVMGPSAPLTWNDKLYRAAQMHNNDMAQADFFSHTGSGTSTDLAAQALHPGTGSTPSERIEYQGYSWSAYGENLAGGQNTLDEAISAWLNSPGHCANLMNSAFTEVGMSHVIDQGATYVNYWTQDFGKPQ